MGKVIKKCLACGTLNQYGAKTCKKCECPLLADVDQEDEILGIDPMEAALDDAVSETGHEGDMVAQILRERAEHAKKIVAKEIKKEENKKMRQTSQGNPSEFSKPSGSGSPYSFSLGGGGGASAASSEPASGSSGRSTGSFGGFKISDKSYQIKDEEAPGKVHLGGGSLRMQAIRRSQSEKKDG